MQGHASVCSRCRHVWCERCLREYQDEPQSRDQVVAGLCPREECRPGDGTPQGVLEEWEGLQQFTQKLHPTVTPHSHTAAPPQAPPLQRLGYP